MTRVRVNSFYTNWKDMPHVRLGEMVLASANLQAYNPEVEYTITQHQWENGKKFAVKNIRVVMTVHDYTVMVHVKWSDEYGFDISLGNSQGGDKWTTNTGASKHFYSNNYKGALKRILSATMDVEPYCVKQAEEKAEKEAKQAELTKARQDLGVEIGVELVSETWDEREMTYKPSKDYHMSLKRKGENIFAITDIYLEVTEEELKAVIKIIKESPKVMANRLKHGK